MFVSNIRRELRVGAANGSEYFASHNKDYAYVKAKQTIDNRLAEHAAKSAIPGRSQARYSVALLLTPTTKIG